MMDKKAKAKWVAALRSGDYEQTPHVLRRGDSFCCIGVFCDINGRSWTANNRRGFFPAELRRAGVTKAHAAHLARMNDEFFTFSDIADYIEENL